MSFGRLPVLLGATVLLIVGKKARSLRRRGLQYLRNGLIVPELGVGTARLTSSVPRPVRFGPFRQRYNNFFVLTFIVRFIKLS